MRAAEPRRAASTRSPDIAEPPLPRPGPRLQARCSSAARPAATREQPSTSVRTPGNFIRDDRAPAGAQDRRPEEVAWRQGFLHDDELRQRAEPGEVRLRRLPTRAGRRRVPLSGGRPPLLPGADRLDAVLDQRSWPSTEYAGRGAGVARNAAESVGADHVRRQPGRRDHLAARTRTRTSAPPRWRARCRPALRLDEAHQQLGDVPGPRRLADLVVDDVTLPARGPAAAMVRGKQGRGRRTARPCGRSGAAPAPRPAPPTHRPPWCGRTPTRAPAARPRRTASCASPSKT